MRKITFYPRLALWGLYRNLATYIPYLIACLVSIVTFYTLMAINFNESVHQMEGGVYIASFTMIGSVVLMIFCTALLFYTNSFLIKRRKKELSLYSILGMEKRNISVLMLFETLFIASFSIIAGLLAGALLSRLLFLILLRAVRFPVTVDLPISGQSMAITAIFFGLIFLLTLIVNLRQVRVTNPVELLTGARHGEREPKSSWLLTLVGVLSLGGGYCVALRVQNPVEAILLFFLAVLLVIIGTFCLFTSGSVAVLKALRANKSYYYKPNHFISVSGMIYRMKQNASGLATICILSCMVLVTVSCAVVLYVGAEDSLNARYPYDFTVKLYGTEDMEAVMDGIDVIRGQNGLEITETRNTRYSYVMADNDGDIYTSTAIYRGSSNMTDISLMPLEDYNRAEGKNESLAPGEALLFCTGGARVGESLTLDGIAYSLRRVESLNGKKYGGGDVGKNITLILPDVAAIEKAAAARPSDVIAAFEDKPVLRRDILFNTTGSREEKLALYNGFREYALTMRTTATFHFQAKEQDRMDWYVTYGGLLFLGVYFGILFMLTASMIIYYKQISEGSDDVGRYEILQKVGMSETEVKKSINGQILSVFFLPLIVAVIHMCVAFHPIRCAVAVFGIFNTPLMIAATAATVLLYAIVYTLVYRGTAKTYYNLVRRQT